MKFVDLCIRRPVFTTMLVVTLLVLGTFSFFELGVDLFPRIDLPNIVVSTRFPGAGPEEVETQITKVLEEAVNTISGIDELRSQSFEGLSQVVVVFKLNRDPDDCAQDVRDRIGRVLGKLPQGVDPPIIEKFDPDAAPIMTVVVGAPMPVKELTEFAKRRIKESIESVNGVGQVNMVGGREREIHVELDAERLLAYGITPLEVKTALQRQNIETPGGLVETGPRDLMLRTQGRIEKLEDFGRVVVREVSGSLIRVADLAAVHDAQEEQRTLARLDGKNAVALIVQKQSGTNTVEVVRLVKERLKELESILPKGGELVIQRDQSRFILSSFHAVMEHLILGGLLASLCVFLFLGNLSSTLISAVAIPTSIVATFTIMRLQGFTLNQMSMLGLTLAVGLVIDDAIVVLENIVRHMHDKKLPPAVAASTGTSEIALAVAATTLSLVVIFVPVAFMPGIIGRFLKEFGLTMAFSIMVSMLISFTLTPMLCAYFLSEKDHGEGGGWVDRFNNLLTSVYMAFLRLAMRLRWLTVAIAAGCLLATGPLMKVVKKDFIPADDQSEFLVSIKGAEGTSLHETARVLEQVEKELRALPGVEHLLTTIGEQAGAGMNEGQIYVDLSEIHERSMTQFDYMRKSRDFLKAKFPQLRTQVSVVPALAGGGFKQNDLNLTFQGPDLDVLRGYAKEIVKVLDGLPGVVDLDSSVNLGKPELKVVVDRTRAAANGVDLADLASTLRTLVGGDEEDVTKFKDRSRSEEYEVRVRLGARFRNDPQEMGNLPVRARDGLVRLRQVADVSPGTGPTEIQRYGRQRQVSIFSNLQGIGLGEAQERIDARLRSMTIAPGYTYGYLGRSKVMKEQQAGFVMAFLLSTIFVYIILAAQFESFLHPITILISLPLSIPFGVLSLVLSGEAMNLYSTLGLFMLFGVVKKNAILVVDYINTLREEGMERHAAILAANQTRLRPILMTTLTLVAGMIPMAFGTGPGSGSRRSMALVVIGGQMLCLMITLLITPVAYSIFDDIVNSRIAVWLRSKIIRNSAQQPQDTNAASGAPHVEPSPALRT